MDWHDSRNHVALPPGARGKDDGLAIFLQTLGFQGVCAFQTSGSEGLPKWVVLTKEAFLISAQSVNAHFEVAMQDHWLVALPTHHVGGFSIAARAYISGSRVTVWEEKWQPQAFTHLCRDAGITLVSLVPAQVHDLVRQRLPSPDSVRAVIVGGGSMAPGLAESALELGWRVFQSYGMTEAASQIATQPYNDFGPVFDVTSLEVLPHWKVATDPTGVLILSGPALALGHAMRSTTGEWAWHPLPRDGWTTRDRVKLWMHGTRQFLAFEGRESGYVKILGELVHLAPLQELLEGWAIELKLSYRPVLLDVPDPRAETRLLLVAEGEKEAAQLLADRFHQSQPSWMRLSDVLMVDKIPRSELGKPQMAALRQWAMGFSQERISG